MEQNLIKQGNPNDGFQASTSTPVVSPAYQPLSAKPLVPVLSSIKSLRRDFPFVIFWLWLMFVILLTDVFDFILLFSTIQIPKLVACIGNFIIAYFVGLCADTRDVIFFYIALGLYIIWAITIILLLINSPPELIQIMRTVEKIKSEYDMFNIFELIFVLITACVLASFKIKFDKLKRTR